MIEVNMSKRFGRNQKRKMRQQIEASEEQGAMWKKYYEDCRELSARNRQIVEKTAHILGRNFIALDPQCIEIQHLDQLHHGWRIPFLRNMSKIWELGDVPLDDFVQEMALPILRYSDHCDDMRMQQHFRFSYRGEVVGYAIGDEALMNMPDDMAVEHIAQEMARFLLQGLRKRKTA